jgi:hypothetical protein
MREIAVYLMAEETGNEAVRQRYKQHLQRYVRTLYHIGMGEWDSSTYHGHTVAAYLNLYDFARDREVKQTAKAALDWLSTAAAVKYYRGGWAAPSKRDYNDSNRVFGAAAPRFFWLYFGDAPIENSQPERDLIHAITSAYRPPQAIVALARKQFDRPVELLSSKPIYQNWLAGGDAAPAYWETTFFGETYQLGSVVSAFADGDVHPFKLLAESQRGVDCVVVNTGGERVRSGKHPGDQLGQYRNLLIWLRPTSSEPFFLQLPKWAAIEMESGIWFIQLERTWLAIHPIHLSPPQPFTIEDERYLERYPDEHTFVARAIAGDYAGFALEVGEPQTHGSYAEFKQRVKATSQVDLEAIATGTVHFTSSTATTLQLTHNSLTLLPTVERNGTPHNWLSHRDLYASPDDSSPISLGWKQGNLRVEAGGKVFESSVQAD